MSNGRRTHARSPSQPSRHVIPIQHHQRHCLLPSILLTHAYGSRFVVGVSQWVQSGQLADVTTRTTPPGTRTADANCRGFPRCVRASSNTCRPDDKCVTRLVGELSCYLLMYPSQPFAGAAFPHLTDHSVSSHLQVSYQRSVISTLLTFLPRYSALPSVYTIQPVVACKHPKTL